MTVSPDTAPPVDSDAAFDIDARGLPCPQPLLALRRALREQPPGTLLRVRATDPASWRDFHSFAALSGRPLLRAERCGEELCYWLRVTP
ncbi:sulfurtransferase TusA family protein [Microbulbifer sp. SAOS-129_SWC]|uniref:sulfurtransferase TusA family protein n=1 Tax=Microbulbifer sp. SAOS-129_SWC TaxID=3145235 RepID=UPI00321631BB